MEANKRNDKEQTQSKPKKQIQSANETPKSQKPKKQTALPDPRNVMLLFTKKPAITLLKPR
ncbi:hypothetical protein ACVNS2_24000 [Paenibacillus caseinilyticus]|uniref:hypothetical protein n=1 Tax=Paenibacillus mucilaginosus TaxID=61624 RepID=UPI000FFEB013|nr:hypothetical protein [Paenibacillus mucilaginosus]